MKYILMSNLRVLLKSGPLNVVVSKKLISVGSRVGLLIIMFSVNGKRELLLQKLFWNNLFKPVVGI